jgi:hypothetical protein
VKNTLFSFAVVTSLFMVARSNSFAQEESLPEPIAPSQQIVIHSPLVDTSSVTEYRRNRLEIEAANRALRMERNRRLSEARTELQIAQMYAGHQPARPTVNAGFMFNAPPVPSYRWMTFYGPSYGW